MAQILEDAQLSSKKHDQWNHVQKVVQEDTVEDEAVAEAEILNQAVAVTTAEEIETDVEEEVTAGNLSSRDEVYV
jgi:hypothetical protein